MWYNVTTCVRIDGQTGGALSIVLLGDPNEDAPTVPCVVADKFAVSGDFWRWLFAATEQGIWAWAPANGYAKQHGRAGPVL